MKQEISCICEVSIDSVLDEIKDSWSDNDIIDLILDLAYDFKNKKSFLKLKNKLEKEQNKYSLRLSRVLRATK